MARITRRLQPGERIVYQAAFHWFHYSIALAFAGIGMTLDMIAGKDAPDPFRAGLEEYGAVFLFIGLIIAVTVLFRRRAREFAITDRRVILSSGVFRKRWDELDRDSVQTVNVEQGPIGRELKFGTVRVAGLGDALPPIEWVSDPKTVRMILLTQPDAATPPESGRDAAWRDAEPGPADDLD